MTAQISQRQYPTYGPNVAQSSPTTADLLTSAFTFIEPITAAPFSAIQSLFHHLAQDPATAAALNEVYTTRGIFKSAATINPTCDQKFTIDLSPTRAARIDGLHVSLVVSEFLCTAMREGDIRNHSACVTVSALVYLNSTSRKSPDHGIVSGSHVMLELCKYKSKEDAPPHAGLCFLLNASLAGGHGTSSCCTATSPAKNLSLDTGRSTPVPLA